jgi:hypothetical protein
MESTVNLKQLATFIKEIKFCMFSTVNEDGTILIESALVWDAPTSKPVQAAGFVKASVTRRSEWD